MLRSHRFGAMMKSGVSRRSSLTVVRTRCAVEIKLVLCFRLYEECEIRFDRKFTEVYDCQNYQNRPRFDNVIENIKWCGFYRAAWNAVAV